MSDAKHTPGPWEANYTTVDGAIVRWHISSQKHGSAYPVCEHMIESAPESSEQIANARLIASAPDLLAACLMVANKLTGHHRPTTADLNEMQSAVNAAIAKAEFRA